MNPDQKDNLQKQMVEWLEQGVIKPLVSPWASPLVPMKKKDQVGHRPERAKQSDSQGHLPLMNIQETLHSLQGATVFLSLDACGAYHAMRIEPGSHGCTVFIRPFDTLQCICM